MIPLVLFVSLMASMSSGMPPHSSHSSNPCIPSPCGPNSDCTVTGRGSARCLCVKGFFPKPDSISGCDYQCRSDSQCGNRQVCSGGRCVFSSSGSLGSNSVSVLDATYRQSYGTYRNRQPISHGSTGTVHFSRLTQQGETGFRDICSPNPCGQNTNCRVVGVRAVCSCLQGHFGNPEVFCRRGECLVDNDCPYDKKCTPDNKCVNLCPGPCGIDAECKVTNRIATCSCPARFTGDPFTRCRRLTEEEICAGACGRNTKCRALNDRPICSCLPGYFGDPNSGSGCRAECETDSECSGNRQCRDLKCIDPCVGACGSGAECTASGHRAVCSCPRDYLGDPNVRCYPECTQHNECPSNKACLKLKCGDPCIGACGTGANCVVENHKAICSCPKGYTGHPFEFCRPFRPEELCQPSPCGTNAECNPGKDSRGEDRAVCTCPRGYLGDPLHHCQRGECLSNDECPDSRACVNFNCVDPCLTKGCGINAQCSSKNHAAICSCPENYIGDPLNQCTRRPEARGFFG